MALDLSLATAKKAAAQVGATPPPNYPGGNDQWYVDWFTEGVNKGDARLLRLADPSATVAEGGGEKDLVTDWHDAAPSSEWMGKRKPTGPELRRFAMESGGILGEDYARFGDRVLADWINKGWDIAKGGFFTTSGQQVAKPPDVAGDKTWVQGFEGSGTGPGVGAGGGGGAKVGKAGPAAPYYGQDDPLQRYLTNLISSSGGFVGQGGKQEGAALQGGGVWWAPQSDKYDLFGMTRKSPRPVGGGPAAPPTPATPGPAAPTTPAPAAPAIPAPRTLPLPAGGRTGRPRTMEDFLINQKPTTGRWF